ncbi:MAG: shikimate kinase [Bryobacterales bacterium]|nr:shikimate kinase [Bryobacterales bacterium]
MILKLKRTPGLYLVGFMGCGKSVVGTRLAEKLGWGFGDLDADIVASQGISIAEIFDTRGEEEFRRLETEALLHRVREVQAGNPLVLALGGGAFVQPLNYRIVEDNGITVWLDCPLPLIRRRLAGSSDRPLARDPRKFEILYYARRESYALADYRVPIQGDDPEIAVQAILDLPVF